MAKRKGPNKELVNRDLDPVSAEKSRRTKIKQIVEKLKKSGLSGKSDRYCIIDPDGKLWRSFSEFSGLSGAKRAFDLSGLPSGSAVVRVSDGVELARMKRSASYGLRL